MHLQKKGREGREQIMLITALLTITKGWKQSKCLLTNKWINKCVKHIQWNISQP